jgi:hypothetical protein
MVENPAAFVRPSIPMSCPEPASFKVALGPETIGAAIDAPILFDQQYCCHFGCLLPT